MLGKHRYGGQSLLWENQEKSPGGALDSELLNFSRNTCSNNLTVGAQVEQVDEPPATFIFELEAYPEAKSLSAKDLNNLYARLKSFYRVAGLIGASEAFVRQNCKKSP